MTIQRLENIAGIPTWVDTSYGSLKDARTAEPTSFFRVKRSK